MNALPPASCTLLALELIPQSRAEEWAKVWPKKPTQQDSSVMLWLLVAVAAAILISVVYRLVYRYTHRTTRPVQVFIDAARHMGLDHAERKLLGAIAAYEQLPTPLTLMLSQGTLNHHLDNFSRHQKPEKRERTMTRIASIRQKLFAATAQEIIGNPPADSPLSSASSHA